MATAVPFHQVSPPIPVGRLAGRFKLQLWRASSDFQLKLPLASQRGPRRPTDTETAVATCFWKAKVRNRKRICVRKKNIEGLLEKGVN